MRVFETPISSFFRIPPRCCRLSDVITVICIPATVVLFCYGFLLSRDLRHITAMNTGDTRMNSVSGGEFPAFGDTARGREDSKDNGPDPIPDSLRIPVEDDVTSRIRVAPPLNITARSCESLLFWTAIPRTGQTFFREVFKDLKEKNRFQVIMPRVQKDFKVQLEDEQTQENVVVNAAGISNTSVVFHNFAFVDFSKFDRKQPIQVAMVRDPVQRAISMYYYARAPPQIVERNRHFPDELPNRAFLKKSMEMCMDDPRDMECNFNAGGERQGHTIQYFCGQKPFCKFFATEEGFEQAKSNVENHFAVVGILEDLEKTLVVLEHYVPRFFHGAYKFYSDKVQNHETKNLFNKNTFKPSMDYERDLEVKFKLERRFYNFLRDRLNRQYEKIVERSRLKERLKN